MLQLRRPSARNIALAGRQQSQSLPCPLQPAGVCTGNSAETCYFDPTCSDDPPRLGGLGCNAGGVSQNCRFCGFGQFPACPDAQVKPMALAIKGSRIAPVLPCPVEPAGVCTGNSAETCYFDRTCSDDPPRLGGLGCNAGGVSQNCRFCGFGSYPACPDAQVKPMALVANASRIAPVLPR